MSTATTEDRGIKKSVQTGKLTISRVYAGDYQKEGTLTAEIKQVIQTTTEYPTKSIVTDLQDNIFSMADFGFETKKYENKETRVAWIDIPVGNTVEQVQAKVDANPAMTLYKILSNRPILTNTQNYAIADPTVDVTIDVFANRQAVRFPDTHESAGKLALDANGKIQYRAVFFSAKEHEDSDLRTAEPADFYASQSLKAEISSVATIVEDQKF